VLRLLANGTSNRDIAVKLRITENTAANHVRSILIKTGASNRTHVAMMAEPESLFRGDVEAPVIGEHPLISAEPSGVVGWATEDLAPPARHVVPMCDAHAAREERTEEIVGFDAVVERVDQSLECRTPASPLVECRRVR
jgi:hypothetical protein